MAEIASGSMQRWEKRIAHGAARYYEIRVEFDLWGELTLTRIWGRRGSARGRVTHTLVPERDMPHVIDAIARRRQKHGYSVQP